MCSAGTVVRKLVRDAWAMTAIITAPIRPRAATTVAVLKCTEASLTHTPMQANNSVASTICQ